MQKLDWVAQPSTVEEFYLQYRPRVEASVRRQGIVEWEDVASDILCRFIERDFLSKYDPEFTVIHDGVTHTAKFARFVDGFVKAYCRGFRDRERRRFRREALVLDAPVAEGSESQADLVGVDFHSEIEGYELVASVLEEIFQMVDALPTTSRRDLGVFSRAMVAQFLTDEYEGTLDRKALADEMRVSVSTVGNWLQSVRDEVSVCADQLR